jgi:nitrous oxidase accessory protein NosD
MGRFSLLTACVGGLLLLLAQGLPVHAEVICGMTISEEVLLKRDLACDTPTAITVEGPGGQLNLGGHTVSCISADHTNGILLVGEKAKVTNGTVTNCQLGVVAADKGHHRIIEITSLDHSGAGFTTGGLGIFVGSKGNFFITNHAKNSTDGFFINGNENFLFDNSSVESLRGFVVTQKRNKFTLNVATNNDVGFSIQLGADENHFIKNLAEENAFAGFEIGGNRNKLVKNRATGNGRNMIDVGFRIIDANDNFLAWNHSEKNTGFGFEIVGFFIRSERNVLRGNLAHHNEQVGIALQLLAENNTVMENDGKENGTFDLQDANPDCNDNTWIENTFTTADPEECIQ